MKYGRHLTDFRAAFFDIGNTCFNQVHGQIPPANIDAVHRLQEKGFHYDPYFEKLLDVAITYSGHRNTDLIPAGVTKATGIHQLMKLWRLPGHDYLCFGDIRTDIPMLKDVCLGIAMEHAKKEVMLHADAVCGRSDCNGISSFLRASSLIKRVPKIFDQI